MRNSIINILSITAIIFGSISTSYTEEIQEPPPYEPSAAFKQIEKLEGSWAGKLWSSHNDEYIDLKLDYKVISARSTIVETVVEGETEMISLYHEKDNVLRMKHYCALRTQPELDLSERSDTALSFVHAPGTDLVEGQDDFVNSYKISYDPETPNELKTYYTVTFADGQMWNRKGTLTRVD